MKQFKITKVPIVLWLETPYNQFDNHIKFGMRKEIVHNTCCTQHDPHYPNHKRIVYIWLWTTWDQTSKILPQLTTQRTKENEENSLLSLPINKKYEKRSSNPSLKRESYIYRIPRWPLGYIWPLAFHIPRWLLTFHFPKVTLGISLLF